jgi:integrase/recombinase XerD
VGFVPCLVHSAEAAGGDRIRLGHHLLDAFLEFVAGRARWNTVLATAFDLKVFFSIIDRDPAAVTSADVLAFIQRQRARGGVRPSCGSRTGSQLLVAM